jgi:hypothetical protein
LPPLIITIGGSLIGAAGGSSGSIVAGIMGAVKVGGNALGGTSAVRSAGERHATAA